MELTILRHRVPSGLSPLQDALLTDPHPVRIASAPTGAGKSYAFQRAMAEGARVLFLVPTRRLAQNLARGLVEDLCRGDWTPEMARDKVAIWSSDASQALREQGVTRIGPWRVRQFYELDPTREGGEMIVAIPESLSYLLVQRHLATGQTEGVFDLMNGFEHIVFDEFHTIEARGFGLAAVLARLAASGEVRAKVSFLSATPLTIRPVLEQVGVPAAAIVELAETVSERGPGRALHGDVVLALEEAETLAELLHRHRAAIAAEIQAGRQVVAIYNALVDLRRQLPELERMVRTIGLDPGRVLLIDSIDDSRTGETFDTPFSVGRQQEPTGFDLLIATASLEMGVTFDAHLLLMEPGFAPLNFLQRYGRAARGDRDGRVVVRLDERLREKNPWLRGLADWIGARDGQTATIEALTTQLTAAVQRRFRQRSDLPNSFGTLPSRAAYCAGLYWLALLHHKSNSSGHRRQRLETLLPPPARHVRALLAQVRGLAADRQFATAAQHWCAAFATEALKLRGIGSQMRVRWGRNSEARVAEDWLRRHTDLDTWPVLVAEDGEQEIRLYDDDCLDHHILDQSRYVESRRTVAFPHATYTEDLPDGPELPQHWCRVAKEGRGPESIAWDLYPNAMRAATDLVRLTGLVVTSDAAGTDALAVVIL